MIVVIMMEHSLFADGVINRLKQHLETAELQVVDARQPDALEQIFALQPSTVIIVESNPEVSQHFFTDKLMDIFSALNVIRLNIQSPGAQIIHWDNFDLTDVSELLDVLEPPASFSFNHSVSEVS